MKNPIKFIQEVKQEAFKGFMAYRKRNLQGAIMVFLMALAMSLFFLLIDQVLKFFSRNTIESEFIMKIGTSFSHIQVLENKVAGLIKEEAEKAKIAEKFEEIIVPTHDVTEVKRGKRVQRKKILSWICFNKK